jgi:homoserine O-acetyltransferase
MAIRLTTLVAVYIALAPADALPRQQPGHAAERHEFAITNFRTETEVTLPKARIVYGTYGQLNAAPDNVVLLPSHYVANHHGYESAGFWSAGFWS